MGNVMGVLVENSIRTLTQRSRRASGWEMECKRTRGMRWGFPREVSVVPELGEVEGCVVGNEIGMGGWLGVWMVEV